MTKSDPFEQSHTQDILDERKKRNLEQETFEEVYPRYEFSELVRLFLALVTWLQRMRLRRTAGAPEPRRNKPTAGPHATA